MIRYTSKCEETGVDISVGVDRDATATRAAEAFVQFLLAVGYHPNSIQDALSEASENTPSTSSEEE